jgi:hypothetical protein
MIDFMKFIITRIKDLWSENIYIFSKPNTPFSIQPLAPPIIPIPIFYIKPIYKTTLQSEIYHKIIY